MRPRPLAAPRAPRCAAAGRRAGSLAEPTAPGLRGLLHQSPCEKLFSFLFPTPLSEESFQQIKEKLSMPALLAGGGVGGSYGGISVPCDFIVCVIKHPRLAPPTHATSAVWDCPPGSSARLCHPVRVGRMNDRAPSQDPSTSELRCPFGSGRWVPQSEGLAVSKGVRITEVQREGDPEQPPNLTQ